MNSKMQGFADMAEDKPKRRKMPPNAGKGRKAGVPNKVTGDVKAMILGALRAGWWPDLPGRAGRAKPRRIHELDR